MIHNSMLFFNKEKKCNLRKELAGPPDRGEKGEVLLRLVGGRWASLAFLKSTEADNVERTCQAIWTKAAKSGGPGLAPAVSRLLEAAAAGARKERSRSRSQEPNSKRLLRRLSSVEVEGMYRLQRVQDIHAEKREFHTLQQQQIADEFRRRKMMTRAEFIESLRKEAELQRKISFAEREEDEERQRFEALRAEEERIFLTLQESDREPLHEDLCEERSVSGEEDKENAGCQEDGCSAGLVEASAAASEKSRPESCVICHDAQRCVVFLPCKHLVCCAECGHGTQRLSQCPMCRAKVVWRFKVFV
jgi:hypothetical protein